MSSPGPLNDEHRAAIKEARAHLGKILRSASIATVTAWTVGIFGALSVLWGLVAGFSGIVMGAALLGVAWNEIRGRDLLRALDPEGARILGWNQIVLAGLVAAYCGWVILMARVAPDPSMQELQELVGISGDLVADLTALAYGAVAVIVVAVQSGLARFHFARGPMMEDFRRETPAWIVELLGDPAPQRRTAP